MKRFLVISFAMFVLSSLQARAQGDTRIQFPKGRSTVTLKGSVGGAKKDYVFYARKGQQLKVQLIAPSGNARFSIFRTKFSDPYEGMEDALEGTKEVTDWSGTLQEEGDYHVYVFPTTQGTTAFTLEVTLTQEKVLQEYFEGLFELLGKAPKGLEGLKSFVFTTVRFTSNGSMPVKPSGNVRAGGTYKMARIAISGESISFETVALRGVSYKFDGKLVLENTTDPSNPFASLLKGHLTKSLNGKNAAEADVEMESVEGVD